MCKVSLLGSFIPAYALHRDIVNRALAVAAVATMVYCDAPAEHKFPLHCSFLEACDIVGRVWFLAGALHAMGDYIWLFDFMMSCSQ